MRKHRKSYRLSCWDNRNTDYYFVTICTKNRRQHSGNIVDGKMRLNHACKIVRQFWADIPGHFKNIPMDTFVIMPNHIHGIIRRGTACRAPAMGQFGKPVSDSTPTIIRSFKSAATKRVNEYQEISKQHIWQRNYYEHVIRNDADLNRKTHPSRARTTVLLALLLFLSAATGVGATELKTRYDELSRIIMQHTHLYYTGRPSIPDEEYDNLMNELLEIERAHPEWVTPSSPSQRVGGAVLDESTAIAHKSPMLSIDKTRSAEGLKEFAARVKRELNRPSAFYVEHKFDGVAISLQYEKGVLLCALTRGDGLRGDDVTSIVKEIPSVPRFLKGTFPSFLEVRGEIYIPKIQFEKINETRQKHGEKPFTNARNLAAGSLYLKDTQEAQERGLKMTAFAIGQTSETIALTQQQLLEKLNEFGFSVHSGALCHSINDVMEVINHIDHNKNDLAYDIDGAVIKVNNLNDQMALGTTSRSARGMIAFKFDDTRTWTTLREIVWQVGRTGKITPVAILGPVWLDGSLIERASLHNFGELQRLGLRVGDDVLIEKAGRIIPKIIKRKKGSKNREGTAPTAVLQKCPACLFPLAQSTRNTDPRCVNSTCPERIKQQIKYFTQRDKMDIPGLGPATISRLVDNGCVKNPADLYQLTAEVLEQCVDMTQARIRTILYSINQSKRRPLSRFLAALGIPRLGTHKAGRLAGHFQNIDALQSATFAELQRVPGIDQTTAEAVSGYFRDEKIREMLEKFRQEGVLWSPAD